jgi:hypothetical protein
MLELLALPAWNTPPISIEAWTQGLAAHGHAATVAREASDITWIEVGDLRLRGFVVIEAGHVEAINFEIHDPDPSSAITLIESTASDLGWEIHADDDDPDDDNDDS